jgi:hypothetical protein
MDCLVEHAGLKRWMLIEFIPVARELDVTEERTFRQADTARDYRNLINPAARRGAIKCAIVPPLSPRYLV